MSIKSYEVPGCDTGIKPSSNGDTRRAIRAAHAGNFERRGMFRTQFLDGGHPVGLACQKSVEDGGVNAIALRLSAVKARTGLSRSTIYSMIAEGRFPAPVQLATRAVGWLESEIDEWLSCRIEERQLRTGVAGPRNDNAAFTGGGRE